MLYLEITSRYRQYRLNSRQNTCEFEKQCKTHVSVLEVVSKHRQSWLKKKTRPCFAFLACLYLEVCFRTLVFYILLHTTLLQNDADFSCYRHFKISSC